MILYNVFGDAATRLLFLKLDEKDYEVLKPFLILLNHMPEIVYGINGKNILSSDIHLDTGTVECLRFLK